jgi:CubicO group peptidase (beta-lactamase class C family)
LKDIVLILCALVLLGCAGKSKKDPPESSTLASARTAVSSLLPEELSHYRAIVQRFADSALGSGRFNGSFLVAKNGEIIYEEYSGFRDPKVFRDSITPNTAFHLASVSKPFTAMAVLKLWEEGKLNIDDTVSSYLPGFPCAGVTIRMLMNHRSGIPNYVHYMDQLGWDRRRFITNQDVLNFLIERHKDIQIGAPGKRFSYSNTNYALLALIVEKVTGQFFGDYLRYAFFEPLGMSDSYVYTPADSARSLSSYFYSGRQYAFDFLDLVYGDKNIYSTVRDLHKFDQALSNGQLFRKETLEAAYSGYSFEKPGINNYGLGWRMMLLPNGKKFIYHNGWWHGNRTAFYRLLDEKVTIIALSNNDYTRVYHTKKLADVFGNYFNGEDDEPTENDRRNTTITAPPASEQGSSGN